MRRAAPSLACGSRSAGLLGDEHCQRRAPDAGAGVRRTVSSGAVGGLGLSAREHDADRQRRTAGRPHRPPPAVDHRPHPLYGCVRALRHRTHARGTDRRAQLAGDLPGHRPGGRRGVPADLPLSPRRPASAGHRAGRLRPSRHHAACRDAGVLHAGDDGRARAFRLAQPRAAGGCCGRGRPLRGRPGQDALAADPARAASLAAVELQPCHEHAGLDGDDDHARRRPVLPHGRARPQRRACRAGHDDRAPRCCANRRPGRSHRRPSRCAAHGCDRPRRHRHRLPGARRAAGELRHRRLHSPRSSSSPPATRSSRPPTTPM
jgi:hypothetical protein